MKRILTIALMFTLVATHGSLLSAQAVGVVTGTLTGPSGPLAGVTVNVVSAAGAIIGSNRTTATGAFSVSGLPVGTFAVQAVNPNGAVLATSAVTLSTGAMSATVRMTASPGAMAGSSTAARGASAASGGMRTAAIAAGVAAAAVAAGVVAVVATSDDASPSQ